MYFLKDDLEVICNMSVSLGFIAPEFGEHESR